jgi:hypothetical protein
MFSHFRIKERGSCSLVPREERLGEMMLIVVFAAVITVPVLQLFFWFAWTFVNYTAVRPILYSGDINEV